MERRGTFDRIQCNDGVVLAVLSIEHTCHDMHTHTNYRWLRACTVNSLSTLHIYEKVFHHIEKG